MTNFQESKYKGARPEFDRKSGRGFKRGSRKSLYHCLDSDKSEDERIYKSIRRDWNRQPELRAQYNGNFEKYLLSVKKNITFG